MPRWVDPIDQLLSFWRLWRKPLESIGHDLVSLLTQLWLSSSESPETGDRCRSAIQAFTSHRCCFTGIEGDFWRRGGGGIHLFACCKLEQTLGTRSGKYQSRVCLPHYLVSVSHSNQRLTQTLNFPTEIISCNSWQEGPKKGTRGLIFAIYVVFGSTQNRNAFLLRRKSLFVPLHKSSHVLVSSYNNDIYVILLGVYSCVVWTWIWI